MSPPFDVGKIFGVFFVHTVFCSYKVAFREKSAANGSRALELLLSKLHNIMRLLRLHDATILPTSGRNS